VVHLYVQGAGQFQLGGQNVTLSQETRYPWDGAVALRVATEQPARFGLRLRLPGWCAAPRLAVNGTPAELAGNVENGYARIEREWQDGDVVTLELPMPAQRVYAHPAIAADAGNVAIQRGPLIYCLEQADQSMPLDRVALPQAAELAASFEPELLGGVVALAGIAQALDDAGWEGVLYSTAAPATQPCTIMAIPYYAWDHRAPGRMRVWVREAK
jgi:DUF1680 family protein